MAVIASACAAETCSCPRRFAFCLVEGCQCSTGVSWKLIRILGDEKSLEDETKWFEVLAHITRIKDDQGLNLPRGMKPPTLRRLGKREKVVHLVGIWKRRQLGPKKRAR